MDTSKHEDNKLLINCTLSKFGDLHFVFSNAGIGGNTPSHELEIDEWQNVLDMNLTGVFSLNKLAINYYLENKKTESSLILDLL